MSQLTGDLLKLHEELQEVHAQTLALAYRLNDENLEYAKTILRLTIENEELRRRLELEESRLTPHRSKRSPQRPRKP
jgi:regulator of replication initiation timing